MLKTIICDMDGTLAKSRQKADLIMLGQIFGLSKKYNFVIITGGKLDLIKEQITEHYPHQKSDFILHLFPTSGNQYYFFKDGEYTEVYKNLLKTDDINEILNSIIACVNYFHLKPKKPDQIEYRESQVTFSVLGRTASYEDKSNYDPSGRFREKYVEYIKRFLGKNADKYSIRMGGTTSIDFTYKGRDKGYGLEQIKKQLKLENEEILFFGDKCFAGGNDWEIAKSVKHINVKDENDCLDCFQKLSINGLEGLKDRINYPQ